MKRCLSMMLAVVLLLTCMCIAAPTAHAAKKEPKRAISVVFDNSGSMYEKNNKAWCRATYAMEVFTSMLNDGDEMQIYPMNPIEVGGKQYTMESPLVVKDPKEATEKIHNIFTPHKDWKKEKDATRTHIESIDYAAKGLEKMSGDEKYLVILTDGTNFYENNKDLAAGSKKALEKRLNALVAKQTMKVMYLGIDKDATMPEVRSEYYISKKAKNSADVLATLTELCNQIFGRDSLPAKYKSGRSIIFDISMKKLIVFVQGENIEGLKVTDASGSPVGTQVGTQQTKYSTKGTGKADLDNNPDASLQGMIVTYEDCNAGEYKVEFGGSETSIEVYYEPDADLSFVFTDSAGRNVDPKALYEGSYKVSYGMKDGKTGELIASDLLGNPTYAGSYTLNGKQVPITAEGYSGETPVTLNMGDTFGAELTVTFLGGYTISKDSSDFGWPEGGITVAARPAGELVMKIEGGQDRYSLQKLKESEPFKATFYYADKQLTGEELKKVELEWEPEKSNANIEKKVENDHILLYLGYKNPDNPQETKSGSCTVPILALYAAKGSSTAQTQENLKYYIDNDFSPLQVGLYAEESYIVISEMGSAAPIVAELKMEGKALTAEQFAAVKPTVDCSGLEYELKAEPEKSRYLIYLKQSDGVKEGDYEVTFTAEYTDKIGRTSTQEAGTSLTMSNVALWKKILFWSLLALLALILLILILRIRVFPKPVVTKKNECELNYDNDVVETAVTYPSERSGKQLKIMCRYNGDRFGIIMSDIEPGKQSFLCKPSKKRTIMLKLHLINKSGPGDIQEANVAGTQYEKDDNGKLVPVDPNVKTRELRHGDTISFGGTILNAGIPVPFTVTAKISYTKSK